MRHELHFSTRYRLQRQVKRTKGLLFYFPLHELSGNALDYGPNRVVGTAVDIVYGRSDKSGRMYDLDGAAGYVECADNATTRFEATNSFTAIFVINADALDNNVLPRFWEKKSHFGCLMGDSGNGKFKKLAMELIDTDGTQTEFWANTTQLATATTYFIAQTYDPADGTADGTANRGKTYINGTLETTDQIFSNNGTLGTTNTFSLFLGRRRTDLLRNFDGGMSNFAIFNSNIGAASIYRLAQKGGFV